MDLLEARRQVQVTLAAAVQAALELQAVRAQGDETPEKKKAIEAALRTSHQAEDAYGKATHRVDINEQLLRAKVPALEQVQKNWGSTRQEVTQAMEAATESVADCTPTLRTPLPDAPQVTPSVPPAAPADAASFPVPAGPHPATPALAACEVGDLRQRLDAFACLPRVTEISAEDCPTETARTENPKFMSDAGEKTAAETPCDVFVVDHRFDQPARFPIPTFGLAGEPLEEPGVVIYEGMRLAIRPDGRYQVRFVAETPAMPVTMRLQFILADQWTGAIVPLTLPPITIPAEPSPKKSATQGTVRPVAARQQNIHHEGRLPILDLSPEGLQVVSRSGVARFGYGLHVP